jgi:hypothetical protein
VVHHALRAQKISPTRLAVVLSAVKCTIGSAKVRSCKRGAIESFTTSLRL